MSLPNCLFQLDANALAALIHDGDTIGVGGLHFCRTPVALLQAAAARGLRRLHYVSWGGGFPLEILLSAGCVEKLTFCFSSLDVFGMAPLFRRACERKELEICELNALAMMQRLHAAQEKLPGFPYQSPIGSDFCQSLEQDRNTKSSVGIARPLPLDVFVLHASRADEAGNVEIDGALGLDVSMAWAARKIIVTVDEIVPVGKLRTRGGTILPRSIITAIACLPLAAWPASSPSYYVTDFRALTRTFETVPLEIPRLEAKREEFLRSASTLSPAQVSSTVLRKHSRFRPDSVATPAEVMIGWLARQYDGESYCSAGAVSPLAIVSYLLAKALHAPSLGIMTCSGGYLDIGARPMLMILADVLDRQTAVTICGGEDSYHRFYQRGLITHEVVSAAQIDRQARTNNQWLSKPDGTPVRLPGQGGMADVANMHRNFTLYLTRHSPAALVEKTSHCSASRGVLKAAEREAAGWRPGKVQLVTNLCVMELNEDSGELELVSLHPGVSESEVREASGFEIRNSTRVVETVPPTSEELRMIREEIDPLGYRRLEFVSAKERRGLIEELVEAEEAAITELLAGEPK